MLLLLLLFMGCCWVVLVCWFVGFLCGFFFLGGVCLLAVFVFVVLSVCLFVCLV